MSKVRRLWISLLAVLLVALALPATAGASAPERLRLDVTGWADHTRTLSAGASVPDQADGIGPGSNLLITIPGEGEFICSANFVWAQGSTRYLGAAGHCFLPAAKAATAGPGADYDAKGVVTRVCVSACAFGGELSGLTGTYVTLGKVAFARQTGAEGDIGNDFGVVQVPAGAVRQLRPSLPVWGGPSVEGTLGAGETTCHYGNAVGFGEVYPTKGRLGIGTGSHGSYWSAVMTSAPGDSGSAVGTCSVGASGVHGVKAIGILTHLSSVDVVVGTTMSRAVALASQAGLRLTPVLSR